MFASVCLNDQVQVPFDVGYTGMTHSFITDSFDLYFQIESEKRTN